MSDMDDLKESYFQECVELLATAEEGLSLLADGHGDDDTCNGVFRAVHSIKGGAGAFGFERIKEFAHVFESALDKVRSGEVAFADLSALMLRSMDQLTALVDEGRGLDAVAPGAEEDLVVELMAAAGLTPPEQADDLDDLLGFVPVRIDLDGDEHDGGDEVEPPEESGGTDAMAHAAAAATAQVGWRITVAPSRDSMRTVNEPEPLFRELATLGQLEVACDPAVVPPLADFDPEAAYLRFTCTLRGDVPRADVERILAFMAVVADVVIEPLYEGDPNPGGPGGSDDEPDDVIDEREQKPEAHDAPPVLPREDRHVAQAVPARPAAAVPLQATETTAAAGGAIRKAAPKQTIRVDLDKVDRLVNLVGEAVISQAMILDRIKDLPKDIHDDLREALDDLSGHTRNLQESVMSIRAQPIKAVFSKVPRIVRDVAGKTGKEVRLETIGEDTEIDNSVIEQLSDPLTHMIRNAVDHGIEPPEARAAAGKPAEGTVVLKAEHRGGRIVISIVDDGKGMDPEVIFAKAVEKGVVEPGTQLSDDEKLQLIFAPGFSTAEKVTDVSGRGVGMDVVRKNIQSLGGRVHITSAPGKGSTFTLSLPLTLAVLDGMLVRIGSQKMVVPLANVIETFEPRPDDIRSLGGIASLIHVRGDYVPLVAGGLVFGVDDGVRDFRQGVVVLMEAEADRRACLLVDEVIGMHQAVIKSLEANYAKVEGIAAATILGDGHVALIIDPGEMIAIAAASNNRSAAHADGGQGFEDIAA